jgi:hypothetical protein
VYGDAAVGEDDVSADGNTEDGRGLEDAAEQIIADANANGLILGTFEDVEVVDTALAIDEGLDDDGGVVEGLDGLGRDLGVEIVRSDEVGHAIVTGLDDGAEAGKHPGKATGEHQSGGKTAAKPEGEGSEAGIP